MRDRVVQAQAPTSVRNAPRWPAGLRVLSHHVETDDLVRAAASLLRTHPEAPVIGTGARPPQFATQGSTACSN